MTGAFSSSQASTMACKSSMLLTLKAPRAYLPLRALANRSLVCVRGIVLSSRDKRHDWLDDRGRIKARERKIGGVEGVGVHLAGTTKPLQCGGFWSAVATEGRHRFSV